MSKRVDEGEHSSPNPNDALVSTLSTMVQTLARLEERMQRVEERQAAPAQPQPNPVLLPRRVLRRGEPRLPPLEQTESGMKGKTKETLLLTMILPQSK